jgi:hypothetical protein
MPVPYSRSDMAGEVAIPKLIPDRLTGPLRARARDADDRLERSPRRLVRRGVKRGAADPDGHTR